MKLRVNKYEHKPLPFKMCDGKMYDKIEAGNHYKDLGRKFHCSQESIS